MSVPDMQTCCRGRKGGRRIAQEGKFAEGLLRSASTPEDERPDGDTSEYIPWDFDNDTAGEADTQDLLDDGLGWPPED